MSLRLADSLVVRSITSDRFGRLFGFRVNRQNVVVINLPSTLLQDAELTLTFVYSGRLEPQAPDGSEAVGARPGQVAERSCRSITAEPSFLYSNRSAWYPQATTTDYATATIKISVPVTYDCVASGVLAAGSPLVAGSKEDQSERKVYTFAADAAAALSRVHRQQVRARRDATTRRAFDPAFGEGQPDAVGRGQPAAGEARAGARRARRRHRAVLRVAHRRRAVPDIHARDRRRRSAGRPQPGLLRAALPAAADDRRSPGATIRRRSIGSRISFSRTSSRISGGDRRSAGATTTSSGSARASRSISRRSTRSTSAATACSPASCGRCAGGR